MAAPRTDAVGEVVTAMTQAEAQQPGAWDALATQSRSEADAARRIEVLSYRMAGLSYETIASRMKITPEHAERLVVTALRRAEQRGVEAQRALENERLDRAQSAIWTQVLSGDTKAISVFLQISAARRQLNGLNAPQKMEVAVGIRNEMQSALDNLEALMLADSQTVEGEVVQP